MRSKPVEPIVVISL